MNDDVSAFGVGILFGLVAGFLFGLGVTNSGTLELQNKLVAQGYAEWYSDEPGAAPDKFRLIEDDEQKEVK